MSAIVMILTERITSIGASLDVAEATHRGRAFTATSRHGATMALARQLVAAGCPDQPVEVRFPDGRLRFTAPSLHRLAELTISEPDSGALRVVPYQECRFLRLGAAPSGVSGAGRGMMPPEPEKPLAGAVS